ncbi:MAG: hypothetical protein ACPL7O_11375, partial [Armatimonadota bacterium]
SHNWQEVEDLLLSNLPREVRRWMTFFQYLLCLVMIADGIRLILHHILLYTISVLKSLYRLYPIQT